MEIFTGGLINLSWKLHRRPGCSKWTKIAALGAHIDKSNQTLEQKQAKLSESIAKVDTNSKTAIESERSKRLTLTKKIQSRLVI
jgi:hypothetical protein